MSKLISVGEQQVAHYLFDASGSIASGATAQLLLPRHTSRSLFMFVNNSSETMYIDFGCGYATATLSSGVVSSVSVANAGFNFTKAPLIRFLGGGVPQGASGYAPGPNTSYVGAGGPGFPAPPDPATAIAVLASSSITGNKINSITVTHGGAGYLVAPYVQIIPSDLDPSGVTIPASTNASSIAVLANGSVNFFAGMCPTDAVSVVGATTGDKFTCKYMT